MTHPAELFRRNHSLAVRVAERLRRSCSELGRRLPFNEESLERLDPAGEDALDAFLKRYEQLVDLVETRLFRGLALLEGEDVQDKSKRDLALLMAKFSVVADADRWSDCSMLRNKLAHDYPDAGQTRADRINAAFGNTQTVLDALAGVEQRVRSRGLVTL